MNHKPCHLVVVYAHIIILTAGSTFFALNNQVMKLHDEGYQVPGGNMDTLRAEVLPTTQFTSVKNVYAKI